MLKVDRLTSLHERVKFTHICVELDLGQPLDSHIYVRGEKFCLEYEGLHSICFRCGKYGHKKDNCTKMLEMDSTSMATKEDTAMNGEASATMAKPNQSNIVAQEDKTEVGAGNAKVNVSEAESMQIQTVVVVDVNVDASIEQMVTNDLEMGPWNIPKYVARKKKPSVGRSKGKETELAKNKFHYAKANGYSQEDPSEANGGIGTEHTDMDNGDDQTHHTKPKIVSKPKIRNPLGGKNPQQPKGNGGNTGAKGINQKEKNSKSASETKGTIKDDMAGEDKTKGITRTNLCLVFNIQ